MPRTIAKGALLGGLTYFVWMNVSWMALGWHNLYMKSFTDELAVATTLKANAPAPGVYTMPDPKQCSGHDQMMAKMAAGPFAYMMVRPEGKTVNMGVMMLLGLITSFVWSGIATYLLLQTRGLSLFRKVGFVKMVGVLGCLTVYFGQWNWWGFSEIYLLVNVIDQGIAWGLVGLVVGKFVVKT